MRKFAVLIVMTVLLLTSCVQTQQGTSQGQMLGTGIGAIGGAIIGQALGNNTGATIIGTAIGAAVGYAVATQITSQTSQVYDARQTQAMVPAAKRNEPVLEIRDTSISPSTQFQAGQDVTVRVTYIVFDENKTAVTVREKKTIWHKGNLVTVLEDEEAVRNNGTYESLISFKLPSEVEKGEYELRSDINTDFTSKATSVNFRVI